MPSNVSENPPVLSLETQAPILAQIAETPGTEVVIQPVVTEEIVGEQGNQTEQVKQNSVNSNMLTAGLASVASKYFWPLLITLIVLAVIYAGYYFIKRKKR